MGYSSRSWFIEISDNVTVTHNMDHLCFLKPCQNLQSHISIYSLSVTFHNREKSLVTYHGQGQAPTQPLAEPHAYRRSGAWGMNQKPYSLVEMRCYPRCDLESLGSNLNPGDIIVTGQSQKTYLSLHDSPP